jgi:hypothetical protein
MGVEGDHQKEHHINAILLVESFIREISKKKRKGTK